MEKKSFEQMMSELEELVSALESGDTELEEALAMYKKGVGIIENLSGKLDKARKQIETVGAKQEVAENE